MIDWTKPIETVDGRAARLVEAVIEKRQHIVYVYGKSDDVFLVDPEGYRCDDRITYMGKRQELFIRNVRVKREGWVNIYAVHKTEAAAIQCRSQNEGVVTRFVRWEE